MVRVLELCFSVPHWCILVSLYKQAQAAVFLVILSESHNGVLLTIVLLTISLLIFS